MTADTIAKAVTHIILDQPFFACLLLKLQRKEDTSCETMYTDGVTLGYNPKFVDSLAFNELKAALCHEVLHCAMLHITRRGNRDPKKWNQAADYAINGIIKNTPGLTLRPEWLYSQAFDGKSAEEIYSIIPDPPPGGGGGNDPTGPGEVRDCPASDGSGNPSPADLEQMAAEWEVATVQAAQAAKAQGKLPAGLDRLIDEIVNPKVNWQQVLREFVTKAAKEDYSWTRPNRRFIGQGIYLPSLHSETIGDGVIVIDTSGSITDELLTQFQGEVNAILEDFPSNLTIIYVDAKVANVQQVAADELPCHLESKGGGGTDFRPAFDWIDENADVAPNFLIYLTDLCCNDYPDVAPDFPTLWINTERSRYSTPPFGEVIDMQ